MTIFNVYRRRRETDKRLEPLAHLRKRKLDLNMIEHERDLAESGRTDQQLLECEISDPKIVEFD